MERIQTPLLEDQPENPVASRLFRLSRELRNEIYHWLWVDHNGANVCFRNTSFIITYDDYPWYKIEGDARLPRWLLTSKAFLSEGLDQLQLKAAWMFGTIGNNYEVETHITSPLLLPFSSRNLTMYLETSISDDRIEVPGHEESQHASLCEVLHGSSNIRNVVLYFVIECYKSPPKSFDLTFLESVALSLEYLEVYVEFTWVGTPGTPVDVRPIIQQEVSRLGKLLIDGDDVEEFSHLRDRTTTPQNVETIAGKVLPPQPNWEGYTWCQSFQRKNK
ncbi:hypothetical protein BDV96DRAFT_572833 [Lophiotrema nucula]|uniref:Uncharacterized protein n=1 Tax=Lophiotrema nucula TaxID=690887 RepID=A0A6A5ZBB8_9PLEO|nr:hypothetical protein BDV96DRAFT_572833 [Lophiotrema nucula]